MEVGSGNSKDYSFSNEYHSQDFPEGYRRFAVEFYNKQESFASECLEKIYNSGRLSGTKLLDFGCGPTIHRIASATSQFHDITLAEWSEENRRAVRKWLRGDKDALDWTPLLEQCARAEGYRDLDVGVAEISRRIRKSVKVVVPCDALSKDILPEGLGEFDVIASGYCLESCCTSLKAYKEALEKLVSFLKKGGALVMVAALECKQYSVHKNLPVLYLTEEIIKESLIEAGLEIKDWFTWKDTGKYAVTDYSGMAVYYCVKPKI